MLRDIFSSPQVTKAFARAETLLGGTKFKLADGRVLTGVVNRIRNGRTMLDAGFEIEADFMVVATKPQFGKRPPLTDEGIVCEGADCQIVGGVETDEVHFTFYCARRQ